MTCSGAPRDLTWGDDGVLAARGLLTYPGLPTRRAVLTNYPLFPPLAGDVAGLVAVPPAPAGLPVRAGPLLADADDAAPDGAASRRRRPPLQPAHRRRVAAEGLRLAARRKYRVHCPVATSWLPWHLASRRGPTEPLVSDPESNDHPANRKARAQIAASSSSPKQFKKTRGAGQDGRVAFLFDAQQPRR